MNEILKHIETILQDNLYCEDNKLYIKNKLKYDIYNLLNEIDSEFILQLEKELEYERE